MNKTMLRASSISVFLLLSLLHSQDIIVTAAGLHQLFAGNWHTGFGGIVRDVSKQTGRNNLGPAIRMRQRVEMLDRGRFVSDETGQQVAVWVNTSKAVHTVEDAFISYAIDMSILEGKNRWQGFNFSSVKLHTLLSTLSPSILRLGGTASAYVFYDATLSHLKAARLEPNKTAVLMQEDVVNLVDLTRSTGARLLIDLNIQQRYGNQWDPSNAVRLMDFLESRGYGENIDWELGNEPEYYTTKHIGLMPLTPEQIADDFQELRRVLDSYKILSTFSRIVGPDIGLAPKPGSVTYDIFKRVVNSCGSLLHAATFHHYYFGGDTAKYEEYLDPKNFPKLVTNINFVQKTISDTQYPKTSMWLGETSDAYNGGTVNISDRFASSFLWLEKLGVSAQMGVSVVVRQVIYGGHYPLLDGNLDPNPDYWVSMIHRKLVGQDVLDVKYSDKGDARVYAHCTRVNPDTGYKPGAVTVFVVNINTNISLSLIFQTQELSHGSVDMYLLTPGKGEGIGSVLSKEVMLNGNVLKMPNETSMPKLTPITISAGKPIDVPLLSLAFLVFPEAAVEACMQ